MNSLLSTVKYHVKNVVYRSSLAGVFCPRYIYNFEPAQLAYLCRCIDRTRDLPGPVFEVGCYLGATTIWLNRHMDVRGIEKPYVAVDTFAGFVPGDVAYEVTVRGKSESIQAFDVNSRHWFDKTMRCNGIRRVRSFAADASTFDYAPFREISLALIDVDLYLPVRNSLERIWPQMARGGIIVVDDCQANRDADGALDAYREFVRVRGLPERVVHGRLGVIEVD